MQCAALHESICDGWHPGIGMPVPLTTRGIPLTLRRYFVGPASAGKASSRRKIEGSHAGLFLAKANPTDTAPVFCGTGFSREVVGRHAAKLRMNTLASSRLKPVPQVLRAFRGTGFSREGVGCHTAKLRVHTLAFSRLKPVPLKYRGWKAEPASAVAARQAVYSFGRTLSEYVPCCTKTSSVAST
jgi:hypothetical protein